MIRIGALEADGPEVFSQIRDLEVGPTGRIYVLDRVAQEIRVFGRDGGHLFTFGGKGQGPAEFGNANGMSWGPDGALWVNDPRNNRVDAFTLEGSLVASYPRFVGGWGARWEGGVDTAGRLYDTLRRPGGPLNNTTGVEITDYVLLLKRFDPETGVVDSLPLHHTPTRFYRVPRGALPIPFARSDLRLVLPTGEIWTGYNDRYRIARTDLRGDTVALAERNVEPRAVSPEERRDAIARLEELQARINDESDLDHSAIPETRPAFQYFFVDDEGRLWVRSTAEDPRFDVFASHGRLEAEVEVGFPVSAIPRPVVRDGWLYGVTADSLGVNYVVGGEIRGSGVGHPVR